MGLMAVLLSVQFVVGDGIRPEDVEQSSQASILEHFQLVANALGHFP